LRLSAPCNLLKENAVRLTSPFVALYRSLIAAIFVLSFGPQALAGWYQVENYEGEVGGRPIHFSLQHYSFGSGISVEGSYYFTAERRPVPLYGTLTDRRAVLCEIASDAELHRVIVMGSKTPFDLTQCPLVLTLDDDQATGQWTIEGIDHAVTLRKTASLDDRSEPSITGTVAIPFWAQTQTHMFVGRYEKTDSGICMSSVGIINKPSGKVDQELRFGGDPCDAGMVMTPIYMNVERWDDAGTEIISINFRDGRAGYSENYIYDTAAKRFVTTQRPEQ